MTYPDFTTSAAPDFVSRLLRIPGDLNNMANANARTQIAQQEQATRKWMAQINAEKAAQEMAYAPAEEARKQLLAEAELKLRKNQGVEIKGRMTEQSFNNMTAEIKLDQIKKAEQDRNVTRVEMEKRLAGLQPYEFAGPEGEAIIGEFSSKFNNPLAAHDTYKNFAASRQTYANAVERNNFDDDTLKVYKEAVDVEKLDEPVAMARARQVQAEIAARREAQKQVVIEQAKQAFKPDSLTPAEEEQIRFLVGPVPKNRSQDDPTSEERARATVLATNAVVTARANGGKLDPNTGKLIWAEALKGRNPNLDKFFNIGK